MKTVFLQSEILQVLPNTQCQRCGWETCADFAAGLLESKSSINDCLPGGREYESFGKVVESELVPPADTQGGKAREAFIDEITVLDAQSVYQFVQ